MSNRNMPFLQRILPAKSLNTRALVSIILLSVVVVMLTTSVLMFFKKHNTTTSLVHTVLGLAFLLVILLHLKNNFAPIKQYLKVRQRSKGGRLNVAAPLAVALVVVVTALSIGQFRPLLSFYAWGSSLRAGEKAAEQTSFSYLRVNRESPAGIGDSLTIDLRKGPYFGWPQYAVWLETLEGELIQPLYVTEKLANNRFENRVTLKDSSVVLTDNSALADDGVWEQTFDVVHEPTSAEKRFRPESLPVFLHKIAQAEGSPTSSATPDLDGYSGATLTENFLLKTSTDDTATQPYKIRLEINQSFDFNHYYSSNRFPDDHVYSGDGFSAQPSVIYEAVIDPTSPQQFYPMAIVGHGHHSGRDGVLYEDLSNLTTALEIIDRVIVETR